MHQLNSQVKYRFLINGRIFHVCVCVCVCWLLPCGVHVPTTYIHMTCLSQLVKVAKIRTIIMPNIANIGRNCPLPRVITYTQ